MAKSKQRARRVVCPECNGHGGDYPYGCHTCNDDGYVTADEWHEIQSRWGAFDDQFNNE